MMKKILLLLLIPTLALAEDAQITWQTPDTDVGGYEIIYRSDGDWSRLLLTNPDRTSVTIPLDPGDYEARIAVYNTRFCYSEWSGSVHFTIAAEQQPPAMTFSVQQAPLPDPVEGCGENCNVIED